MYWDSEYPTHVEVPEDYWVCSKEKRKNESNGFYSGGSRTKNHIKLR